MQEVKFKQGRFEFSKIIIESTFESGNLEAAEMLSENQFNLWIGSDPNSNYKTWFYFSIQGIKQGATVSFTIMNMNNQVKLFKEGLVPVFRTQNSKQWTRIKTPIPANGVLRTQLGFQLSFKHIFMENSKHYFSFTYPWTNLENQTLIQQLKEKSSKTYIFSNYQKLCLSYKGRPVNILTLTRSMKNQPLNFEKIRIHQKEFIVFPKRRGIFMSARVHPGETASSHIMNGILKHIFEESQLSNCLLENCVFYIIPIINPDGVAEGNFRTDSQGKNLNRYYANPSPATQPQIFHIKEFLITMIEKKLITFCLDLHAHVNKQGAFIYGNSTSNLYDQMKVCLFPKLLSFNSQFFDYSSCNFSEKNMTSKDKGDELSKEGASRVAIFKETGLVQCWTLQCNYNSAKIIQIIPEPAPENKHNNVSHGVLCSKVEPEFREELRMLDVNSFQSLGFSILQSIGDFYQLKDCSRVFSSKLKNMANLEINMALLSLRLIPFRFDVECRKILDNLNNSVNIKISFEKLSDIIQKRRRKNYREKLSSTCKIIVIQGSNSVDKTYQNTKKEKIEERQKKSLKNLEKSENQEEIGKNINHYQKMKQILHRIPNKQLAKKRKSQDKK